MAGPLLAAEGAHAAASFPILPALVLTPLLGALVIALLPRSRPEIVRVVALTASVITGAMSLWLLASFDVDDAGFQFVTERTWIESLDIKFFLGVDGISLFLVVLTGVLFPIALFAAKPHGDEKGYYAWITLLEVGCMGVFLSLDLFLFFIFFELTLVPLYFLIGQWGHGRRIYAANKFFLFTMFGSMFMLVSIVVLAWQAGAGVDGGISFDLLRIVEAGGPAQYGAWLFAGFALAFAIKTPLVPFHTWLPDAHTEAPTAGSIDLAGILLKLGTYGFLRFGLYLFPQESVDFAPVLLTLATIGIIYGAVVAAMQKNLKRLVAYSSVSHMGFAVLGLFALNVIGIQGSIMVMINHGITTGALFVLLGYLYSRRHTYDIAELRGLQKVAPVFAAIFTVCMLASIGVPGLNGFVGEFLALLGTFLSYRWWAVVAAVGVIFAALYLLWAYQRVFHGEPDDANRSFPELSWPERFVMVPLLFLIVFLGVYPTPVLERIQPSVERLVAHIDEEVPEFSPAGPEVTPLVAVAEGRAAAEAEGLGHETVEGAEHGSADEADEADADGAADEADAGGAAEAEGEAP